MANRKLGITIDGTITEHIALTRDISDDKMGITLNNSEYIATIREIRDDITEHITGITPLEYTCTGSALTPTVTTDGTVTKDTDYTVEYSNNIWPGTGEVIITGIGLYQGTISFNFIIKAIDITSHITGINPTSGYYTGSEIKPTVLTDDTIVKDTDYTVTYTDNIEVGTGKVTVSGIGKYGYSKQYTFDILQRSSIESHITGINISSIYYTGYEIKPTVLTDGTVTKDTDYAVTYTDNINVGTGKVTVTGINKYEGTKEYTFTILQTQSIKSHITGINPTSVYYTGSAIEPNVLTDGTVTKNTDYSVTYSDNTEVGTGKVTVTGINAYQGTKEYTFDILDETLIEYHLTGINPTSAYYTGSAIEPTVLTDDTVIKDTDYTVAYSDNTEVGTGKVTITGIGTYSGTKEYTFSILERSLIENYIIGIDPTSSFYTGSAIEPIVLTDGSVTKDTDYTVTYSDNTEIGTGKVTVTGINAYQGTKEYTFDILDETLISSHLTGINPTIAYYTGLELKPTVLTDGTVIKDTDYTVAYSDNIEIGTGKVTITGIGTYGGSKEYTFTIDKASIESHITGINPINAYYTGSAIEPIVLTDGTVTKDTDYTVTYSDNTEVGTGKVTITGIGNYSATKEYTFTILERSSIESHITGIYPTTAYHTGSAITPTVLTDGTVTKDVDYSVTYTDNINVGTGKVTITGINAYQGTKEYTFTIEKSSIESHITGINPTTAYYTGLELKPTVLTDGTVTKDTDYSVTYSDNINLGTGKVTITGINNYYGSKEYTFDILEKVSIISHIVTINPTSAYYTGSEIKPTVLTDGTVIKDTDYSVTYTNNIEVGTGKVTVIGINAYQGTKEYTFDIEKASIESHINGINPTNIYHTGSEIKPTILTDGTITKDVDYSITYLNNINVGTGIVRITGINNYTGTKEYTFTIIEKLYIESHISGINPEIAYYTGSAIEPTVLTDGTITKDTDYTVTYSNNTEVGTGKVTITGIGNYQGTKEYTFDILQRSNIESHITGINPTTGYYTGSAIEPTVLTDGTITKDTDYTVTYSDNIEVGTGKVTITGINAYQGTKEYTFDILDKVLISNHITGINPEIAYYTGSEIKPSVLTDGTITKDTDYTVAYSDNTEVGTGKVTVTGIGDYSGTKEYTFSILNKRSIESHITGINPINA